MSRALRLGLSLVVGGFFLFSTARNGPLAGTAVALAAQAPAVSAGALPALGACSATSAGGAIGGWSLDSADLASADFEDGQACGEPFSIWAGAGCDPDCGYEQCPDGCCDAGSCMTPSFEFCGTAGQTCVACDPMTSDTCAAGSCGCGLGAACAGGQHCAGGACSCDPLSCPTGCCSGVTCQAPSLGACGIGGAPCTTCGANADNCASGVCSCGAQPACGANADTCTSGACSCGAQPACGANQECLGGLCACNSGHSDCNGLPGDGCECAGTLCCSGSCAPLHHNGLGQSFFFDCTPLGTYTESLAIAARAAWPGTGIDDSATCGTGPDQFPVVLRYSPLGEGCPVWAYSGAAVGRVRITDSCRCPSVSDPAWQ